MGRFLAFCNRTRLFIGWFHLSKQMRIVRGASSYTEDSPLNEPTPANYPVLREVFPGVSPSPLTTLRPHATPTQAPAISRNRIP